MSAYETVEAKLELAADGFTSTIDNATSQLGNLTSSAQDTNKAVGALGGVLAGSAAAALGTAASRAVDFEAAMADVEKVTDPQTAAEMGDEIKGLAEDIPLAHDELAELATQAGRMGAEGTEEVSAFTETAGAMASATVMSADEAGTALGKMSSALDEPLEEVDRLGDAINETSNNFQTDSQEIVDATQRSGQALSELGAGSEEIIGLSAAFNEVSPTSRLAASRMQQVSEAMMDPGNVSMFADAIGETEEGFRGLVDESPEEAMMQVMEAVDEGKISYDELSEQLNDATARAFRDTSGSTDRMREAMEMSNDAAEEGGSVAAELATETDTLSGQMALFRNRLNNVAITVGETLTPYLRILMDRVNGVFSIVEDVIDATNGWAATIAALVTIVGGSIAAIGAFGGALSASTVASAAAAAGVATLTTAISVLTGPIGIAIAAVAALGAAYKTNFAGIGDIVDNTVGAVVSTIRGWVETVQGIIGPHLQRLQAHWTQFTARVEQIIGGFVELVSDIFRAGVEVWNNVFEDGTGGIWEIVDSFVGSIVDVLIGGLEWIASTMQMVLGEMQQYWQDHRDEIVVIATFLLETVVEIFSWAFNTIRTVVSGVLSGIQTLWEDHVRPLLPSAEVIFGTIATIVTTAFGIVQEVFETVAPRLRELWELNIIPMGEETESTFNRIANVIGGVLTFLQTEVFMPFVEFVTGLWEQHGEAIISSTLETWDFIVGVITGALEFLYNDVFVPVLEMVNSLYQEHGEALVEDTIETWTVIRDFLAPFVEALMGIILWTIQTTLSMITTLWDIFGEDVVTIVSAFASTVLTIVEQFADFFATAWRTLMALLRGDWSEAWDLITDFFGRTLERIMDTVSMWASAFAGLITTTLSAVWNAFRTALSWIAEGFELAFQAIVDFLTGEWVPDFTGTIEEALDDVVGFFSDLYKDIIGEDGYITNLLSDIKSELTEWLPDFIGFFEDAYEGAKGALGDLYDEVVGNSIVPDMLNETLDLSEQWSGDFEHEFEATTGNVSDDFDGMGDSASDFDAASWDSQISDSDFDTNFDTGSGTSDFSFDSPQMDGAQFDSAEFDSIEGFGSGSGSALSGMADDELYNLDYVRGGDIDLGSASPDSGYDTTADQLASEFSAMSGEDITAADVWAEAPGSGGSGVSGMASDDLYNLDYVRQGDIDLDAASPDDRYDTTAEQLASEWSAMSGEDITESDVRAEAPQMASGGSLLSDGLAYLHDGEEVATTSNVSTIDKLLSHLKQEPSSSSSASEKPLIDFGNLDDDDLVSVGKVKELVKDELQREAKIAEATR